MFKIFIINKSIIYKKTHIILMYPNLYHIFFIKKIPLKYNKLNLNIVIGGPTIYLGLTFKYESPFLFPINRYNMFHHFSIHLEAPYLTSLPQILILPLKT